MFLSVLIPTKDRLSSLKDTIASLERQTFDKSLFEVIILDQSERDKVSDYIASIQGESPLGIRYIFNDIPGLHSNRNLGAKKASGQILVFLDDDVILEKYYLENVYLSFKNDDEISLMTGKVSPKYETKVLPWWLDHFWKTEDGVRYLWEISLLDAGDEYKEISPNFVFGCSYIIKKSVYYKYKGTHPDIFGESLIKYSGGGETILAEKIKKDDLKVVYNPKVCLCHLVTGQRLTLSYFYKRYFLMGISHSYHDIRKTHRRLPGKQIFRDLYFITRDIFFLLISFNRRAQRIRFRCNWEKFRGRMLHKWWVILDRGLFEFILRDNYFDEGKEFI